MGFRPPLDLEAIAARVGIDLQTGVVTAAPVPVRTEQGAEEDSSRPVLRGAYSAAEATSCTDLVCTPEVIWDPNYYYRVHGFTWPYRNITTRDLRRAHHAAGGLDDPYMTLALATLRNPHKRRVYDSQPLGEPVMDPWFREFVKARARRKAQQLSTELDITVSAEDVLEALGFAKESDVSADQEPGSTPPAELSEGTDSVLPPWSWSYYQLRSTCDDSDRLGRWQEMLVQAFGRVGTRRRFCVGFVGRQPHPWVSGEAHGHLIVFLNEDAEPTPEMADQAARSV